MKKKSAINVFSNVKFFTASREFVPPSVKNWMLYFIYIWKKLKDIGFQFLCTRNLNQNRLENFFGCIRSHGIRNINPTWEAFIASVKSLLLNNFLSLHSQEFNCQEDENTAGALDSLRYFLDKHTSEVQEKDTIVTADAEFTFNFPKSVYFYDTNKYVAGYITRFLLQKIESCTTSRLQLPGNPVDSNIVKYRAYKSKALLRPGTYFNLVFT